MSVRVSSRLVATSPFASVVGLWARKRSIQVLRALEGLHIDEEVLLKRRRLEMGDEAKSATHSRAHALRARAQRTHALTHFALTHFANARSCATHSPQRSPLRQSRHRGGSESVWLEPALAETGALPSSACGSTALDSKGPSVAEDKFEMGRFR